MELHGEKYVEENEKVYCEPCYTKIFSIKCKKCHENIGINLKVTLDDKYSWHRKCFVCKRCGENLVDKKYYRFGEELLCSDCQDDHAIAQCHGCKLGISSTVSCLKHKKRSWHVGCFKCIICQTWLANGEFCEMDDNLMCHSCYITKVGRKCDVCQTTITTKGVQMGLKTYHPDCFKCSSCEKSLIGASKVKDSGGQPLCYDCFSELATKCFRCRASITSRHTLYKGQTFHVECFKCNLCGSIINNAEFFETSLNEILCVNCAQIR